MLKRIISLLIIVGMLPMFGVIGLASDTKPRVTGSASDPLSGYYVIYEYDGNEIKIDNLYSDIKTFSTHEGAAHFKIMLWQDIVRLSPLVGAYDSTLR